MSAPSFRALADLARAQHVLQADGENLQAIAALLGIAAPPDAPPAPVPATPDRHVRVEDQGKGMDQVEQREAKTPEETRRPSPIPQSSPSEEIHAVLTPDFTARQPPEWLSKARRLETAGAPATPPVLEPLFLPRWTRAILSGSLSREGKGGLDLETLVKDVSQGRPILSLPRRTAPTLARGAQVLLDRGERMLPFTADQAWLAEQIRTVAGRETVEVLSFDGLPGRGAGPGSRRLWKPYPEHGAPRHGATVAVLTDLGLGAPAVGSRSGDPEEWLALAERLARSGSPLVAFVPYGPALWPAELRRAMVLVHWDRRTSAGDVRRALGMVRQVVGGAMA
jgi:hypothetical protein